MSASVLWDITTTCEGSRALLWPRISICANCDEFKWACYHPQPNHIFTDQISYRGCRLAYNANLKFCFWILFSIIILTFLNPHVCYAWTKGCHNSTLTWWLALIILWGLIEVNERVPCRARIAKKWICWIKRRLLFGLFKISNCLLQKP